MVNRQGALTRPPFENAVLRTAPQGEVIGHLRVLEQVAGHGVTRRDLAQGRFLLRAARHDEGAARMEPAAGRRIRAATGTSPAQHDLLLAVGPGRGEQHGREQRLGIGMADIVEQRLASAPARRSCRDTSPPCGRPCGAPWRDRAPPAGRRRCPAPGCPSAGSSSARGSRRRAPRPARRARSACGREASAAASAMRWRWPPLNSCGYCVGLLGPQADLQQQLAHPLGDLRRWSPQPLTISDSAMVRPTVMRGLSDDQGSWNTACTWRGRRAAPRPAGRGSARPRAGSGPRSAPRD